MSVLSELMNSAAIARVWDYKLASDVHCFAEMEIKLTGVDTGLVNIHPYLH